MSTTKHTPGPWTQSPGPAYGTEDHKRANQMYVYTSVGVVVEVRRINTFGKVTDEDLANARLIAAAPDLLEALKALLPDGLECMWNNSVTAGDQGSCGKCYDCKRYARAHLAIALAESDIVAPMPDPDTAAKVLKDKGSKWAHCPYTGEQRKLSELPAGWKWGKSK